MATTILMKPTKLAGSIRVEPKAISFDSEGRGHTNSFSPEECMMASYQLKQACLKECQKPVEMTQIGHNGAVNKLYYFGIATFKSEKYYLQVIQTVYFNQEPHKNSNLKEGFEVKYRERTQPDFKRVIEINSSWCIMEDVDMYNKLKETFKFLTLIVDK